VTRWVESRDDGRDAKIRTKPKTPVSFKLRSINQLEDVVKQMKNDTKRQAHTEDENVFKTYELFANDLLYLKDLKKYFDDEIFKALMRYHYDPSIDKTQPESPLPPDKKTSRYEKMDDEDSGNGSQNETDRSNKLTGRQKNDKQKPTTTSPNATRTKDEPTSEKAYTTTVEELKSILYKWEGLLSESELDLNNFDPDSYHELMQYTNYTAFEPILRLVPDMFAKCYKCIDLAKKWLTLANLVLKDLPILEEEEEETNDMDFTDEDLKALGIDNMEETPRTEEEFWKQVKQIQMQIMSVGKTISDDEEMLNKYNEEMDVLAGRDERFSSVTSQVEKIDSLITIAAGEYQKAKTEQYAVASRMKHQAKDSPAYIELKSHLKKLDSEVAQTHWKVKRLEFERTMVQEDFMVELDVRPSFIRFMGDTKEKISDLQRFLSIKREEKLKLEKQLALMKTNTERMRKIMRSYLESAASNRPDMKTDSPVSVTEKQRFTKAEDGHNGVPKLELNDGNEADDDASTVMDTDRGSLNGLAINGRACSHKPSGLLQKPVLVRKDLRPLSERSNQSKEKDRVSKGGRVARVGPKPALKTTPRRVWENV